MTSHSNPNTMPDLPNYSTEDYIRAVDHFLAQCRESNAPRRPQNLRFGRLYFSIGFHSFEATWRNHELVRGNLPYYDSLNKDMVVDRADYACGLVKWALKRIDPEKIF